MKDRTRFTPTCGSLSLRVLPSHLHFGDFLFRFFGHFGHRSEWQLIKIDYMGLFSRRCMDGDYQTWHLHNKVTAIINIIDFSPVSVQRLSSTANIRLFLIKQCVSLFDRESCVWWGKSRPLWSACQATVVCWPKTILESIPRSPASAQPLILNGNDFSSGGT